MASQYAYIFPVILRSTKVKSVPKSVIRFGQQISIRWITNDLREYLVRLIQKRCVAGKESISEDEIRRVRTSSVYAVRRAHAILIIRSHHAGDTSYLYKFTIANEIVRRLSMFLNFMNLGNDECHVIHYAPWFYAKVKSGRVMKASIKYEPLRGIIDSQYESRQGPEAGAALWVSKYDDIVFLSSHWRRAEQVLQTQSVIGLENNSSVQRQWIDGINAYIKRQSIEWGKDLVPDSSSEPSQEDRSVGKRTIHIPEALRQQWLCNALFVVRHEYLDKMRSEQFEYSVSRIARALYMAQKLEYLPTSHQLVWIMTCLECLLSSSPTEISSLLAIRASWIISPKHAGFRKLWYDNCKSSYDMRSRVIHGDLLGKEGANEKSFWARTILYLVIRKIFEQPKLFDVLHNARDQKMLGDALKMISIGAGGYVGRS